MNSGDFGVGQRGNIGEDDKYVVNDEGDGRLDVEMFWLEGEVVRCQDVGFFVDVEGVVCCFQDGEVYVQGEGGGV